MKYLNHQDRPYPRVCAHRGMHWNTAPENSIPAFAMAAALGADEIELDLWPDKEGRVFVFHDPSIEHITGEKRLISDLTTKEVLALDIGSAYSPAFKGLRIPTFEEVLDLVGKKCILKIHIKSPVENTVRTPTLENRVNRWYRYYYGNEAIMPPFRDLPTEIDKVFENRPFTRYSEKNFGAILDLLDKYDCREYAYIAGERDVLQVAREMAPDMERCCLEAMNFTLVQHALEFGCTKVQFNKEATNPALYKAAKDNGLSCNLFWCNIGEEACAYIDYGIDTILTDNFQVVNNAVQKHLKKQTQD